MNAVIHCLSVLTIDKLIISATTPARIKNIRFTDHVKAE